MRPLRTDLSIFKKFNFEKPPVGINYLFHKPEGIEQLDKKLALCEMVKEAHQRGTPFYISEENEDCAGKTALGMVDINPAAAAGLVGGGGRIFQDDRANSALIYNVLQNFPRPVKGVINYLAYSPLDQITFEPDLLVLLATPSQAEIVMRAMSYSTGELWRTVVSPVFACASLYVYPYQTGKVNYTITGMSFGMKSKEVFSDGMVLISIPYHWIPTITQSLHELQWVPEAYTLGREEFLKREHQVMDEITHKAENP